MFVVGSVRLSSIIDTFDARVHPARVLRLVEVTEVIEVVDVVGCVEAARIALICSCLCFLMGSSVPS